MELIQHSGEPRLAQDVLVSAMRRRHAILFVGAGVSMTVGLPSWQSLIDHLVEELELECDVIDGMRDGYQMLAEYYRLERGGIGPLRSWLDRNWRVASDCIAQSHLHRLIVDLDFPVIYTTNYDRNLETAFEVCGKPYAKISNAKEIASAPAGVTQIVKYHGDFDDDASLVLTETDFLKRLSFDSPLDLKLRADALANTILFVGYSMSDPNIRLLLYRIWQIWEESGYRHDRPRSFVFAPLRNPVQEAILARWGITSLSPADTASADQALTAFLGDLRARLVSGAQAD
ncbi:putative Sir2-like transcriptional silencer protein [Bradyrhizobium sp. ORS 375]|uniref:SIR2 family NAD-dependent protein deacylase n=1 Tax=Bradyrhizobium sp. (strain ORS 375) TaxID=566679 RepID=UPI0002406307|nr:SIR2 family protein [Bradyrhizobium sp. ORS 375]CCD91851.1 putative Sir2-like transcriptional silencer protein [Bradyrhizobium sp. ORS 375]